MRLHRAALVVAALAGPVLGAQELPPPRAATVDSLLARALRDGRAPGIALAVVREGRVVLSRAVGSADAARGTPVTARTVFLIGSVTKTVTAAAVMRLVEEGAVALDDTVQRFLPRFATPGRRVTIRHLLAHTSGIAGSLAVPPDAAVERVPFDFEPGTGWAYSNAGYRLLGRVVERAGGRSYAELVAARVAAPYESLRACGDPSHDGRLAAGHQGGGVSGGFVPAPSAGPTAAYSAGGLCSTAEALARFADALAGGRVVSPASYASMSAPARLPDGAVVPYGFGTILDTLGGVAGVMHEGAIGGFTAAAAAYPRASLAVAVLANADGARALALARDVARALLDVPPAAVHDLPVSAAERARLVGLYAMGATTACRVLEVDGGIGWTCGGGDVPRRMLNQGGGVFVEPGATELRLAFDLPPGAEGAASGFRELYFGLPLGRATRVGGTPPARRP